MKRFCKYILFTLMTMVIVSLAVLGCSAVDVLPESLDTVGAVMAQDAYEVIITGDSINVTKNKTLQLSAEIPTLSEQPGFTWTSSDEKVAVVDKNGVVKGGRTGRALITATAEVNGQTVQGTYMVNVIAKSNLHKDIFQQFNILSYRYNYVDDYYYADDKQCWQKYFGFGRLYDLGAPYIAFEYDYTRVFYTYEGRDYMVQLWKGQYGAALYGGEIGIYSKPASGKEAGLFTFFNIAQEDEQPNMEVTVYHQKLNGEWEREFTRDYGKYWWCTGFKVGHLRQVEPADELRLVGRITFKNEEIANLFAQGLVDCGFAQTSDKDALGLDSFYIEGSDVYVKWQNISEAETTMPLKIGVGALAILKIFAMICTSMFVLGFGGILILLFVIV